MQPRTRPSKRPREKARGGPMEKKIALCQQRATKQHVRVVAAHTRASRVKPTPSRINTGQLLYTTLVVDVVRLRAVFLNITEPAAHPVQNRLPLV